MVEGAFLRNPPVVIREVLSQLRRLMIERVGLLADSAECHLEDVIDVEGTGLEAVKLRHLGALLALVLNRTDAVLEHCEVNKVYLLGAAEVARAYRARAMKPDLEMSPAGREGEPRPPPRLSPAAPPQQNQPRAPAPPRATCSSASASSSSSSSETLGNWGGISSLRFE